LSNDDNAYVRDGLLVVRPSDRSPYYFTADDKFLELVLSDTVLTAEISEDGLSNVVLAGRWRGLDFIEILPDLGFCMGGDGYDRMIRLVEIQADLRAMPGTGGEGVPCDALSTGIGFDGVRAQWAGLATPPPRVSGCE
jgi:hypothetical protein